MKASFFFLVASQATLTSGQSYNLLFDTVGGVGRETPINNQVISISKCSAYYMIYDQEQ